MKSPFPMFARRAVAALIPSAPRGPLKSAASLCAGAALLALSGCYYYTPYGYSPYPYYYGTVPAMSTQQETDAGVAGSTSTQTSQRPNPAPTAVADAQYPGPLYPNPPVAVGVPAWPAYPAYPAYYNWPGYYSYPAYYGYGGWGWGAPAVSFSVGYWGGGYWGHGGWGHGGWGHGGWGHGGGGHWH